MLPVPLPHPIHPPTHPPFPVQKKKNINRKGDLSIAARANILKYLDQIQDTSAAADGYNIAAHLPGPLRDVGKHGLSV